MFCIVFCIFMVQSTSTGAKLKLLFRPALTLPCFISSFGLLAITLINLLLVRNLQAEVINVNCVSRELNNVELKFFACSVRTCIYLNKRYITRRAN